MTQPVLQTHEAKFHLHYDPLEVYWALGDLLINAADGFAETVAEIDGETWEVRFNYSESGIAPRPSDDVSRETVYEYDLTAQGVGERKVSVNFSPRWNRLRTPDGDEIDTPWQHIDREGVDAHVQGSNIHPDDYEGLIARFVLEIAAEAEYDWRQELEPFGGHVYELERYLRLNADQNKKLIGGTGVMQRFMMLLAEEQGTQAEYSVDNEGRVGHFHAVKLQAEDAAHIWPQHRPFGRQLKSYLPREANAFDVGDALYHPKVGALFRQSLSNGTIAWENREQLVRELDETVMNALAWSDIPLDVGRGAGEGGGNTIFVPDDHFGVEPRISDVPIYPDPTPELEAQQGSILAWALSDTTESDQDFLEVLADGGRHKDDLLEETGWSESTLYRALDRLEGVIESENGHFRYASRRFKNEISKLVDQLGDFREQVFQKTEQLLDYEVRSRADSSFEAFLAKYGAKFDSPRGDGERPVIRIGDLLTQLKSVDAPSLSEVAREAVRAWRNDLRDEDEIREAILEAEFAENRDPYRGPVSAAI